MDNKREVNLITENVGTIKEFNYSIVLKKDKTAPGKGIASLVNSMTLFSSLEDMCMSLEFSLVDPINLVDDNYLQVGSIVEVSIYKNESDDKYKKIVDLRFYITNIDGQIQSKNQKQKSYDVSAYTFAAISNEWPLLEKMQAGTPSEMILDIANRRFKQDQPERIGKKEDKEWINTVNVIKNGIIFHQVKPFDAIAQLLRKSVSEEKKGDAFFFYEDYQGFKLKNLRSMASDENKKKAWKYTLYPEPHNTDSDDSNVQRNYFRVLYLSQYTHTDYFKLIRSGILRSELVFINLLTKEVKSEKIFKYSVKEPETVEALKTDVFLLGNNTPIDTRPAVFGENVPLDAKDLGYDSTPASYLAISEAPWDRDDYLQDKYINTRIQKQLMKQTQITIEVYGNPAIKPGDIVNLEIFAKSTAEEDKLVKTKRQSGDFIVWAVKHTVRGNMFQTIVDLCKDSYEQDVINPPNDDSINS